MAVLAPDQGSWRWGWGRGLGQPRVSGCDARVSLTCPSCLSVSDCPQPPAALRPCPCGPLLSQACLSSLVLVSVCGASFTLSGPGALGWMPAALRQGDTLVGCYEQEHPSTSLEPRGSRLELGVLAPPKQWLASPSFVRAAGSAAPYRSHWPRVAA